MECESTKARLNTELGNCQADLNEVQVTLSRNDGGRDVKDDSFDNMVESPKTMRVDNTKEVQCKDEGETLNRGFSDDNNLDNLTSENNEVQGGDTVI